MRRGSAVFFLAENRLLREALIRLLSKRSELRVVGASGYSATVLEEIVTAAPQVIVLDSNALCSSNAALLSAMHLTIRGLRIVMVDMDRDEEIFLRAVRAGVVGYVLKDASAEEVAATIRAVIGGEAACPPSFSKVLFRLVAQTEPVAEATIEGTDFGLSRREHQMVELLRDRLTNKEIASRLHLSEQTVKNHVHHILRKVGVANRSQIVERCEGERAQPQDERAS
jgi:DNA-binding NarL/FixJ family response regulator